MMTTIADVLFPTQQSPPVVPSNGPPEIYQPTTDIEKAGEETQESVEVKKLKSKLKLLTDQTSHER